MGRGAGCRVARSAEAGLRATMPFSQRGLFGTKSHWVSLVFSHNFGTHGALGFAQHGPGNDNLRVDPRAGSAGWGPG